MSRESALPPMLLCLDLQREYAEPGRPLHAESNRPTLEACGRALAFARGNGWNVAHSLLEGEGGLFRRGAEHVRPVEDLQPLASEPLYVRSGISAFSHPTLRRLGEESRWRLFLIGFSLSHSMLATVFDAAGFGLKPTLVEDAVGATPVGGLTAGRLKQVAKRLAAPFASFTTIEALESARSPAVVSAAWPYLEYRGVGR